MKGCLTTVKVEKMHKTKMDQQQMRKRIANVSSGHTASQASGKKKQKGEKSHTSTCALHKKPIVAQANQEKNFAQHNHTEEYKLHCTSTNSLQKESESTRQRK